jgi:pSer/pThr/pTyr-binding forkhead associated (FHA) protein
MNPENLLLLIRVLAALVLYLFFGLALYTLWQSLPARREIEQHPQMVAAVFDGEQFLQHYPLRIVNMIGRAADNTIVLGDENVSAHHARLSFSGGQWLLEDLGSRNGTYVNELHVESPLAITEDDQILIGGLRLVIQPQSGNLTD